jgi:hypothetical protein
MRLLRRPRVVVITAATAAVITTELAISSVGTFWSRHPVVAGLASGLLLLAVGLWVVEGWVHEHSKPIARQAYRSLAMELRNTLYVLRWSVGGRAAGRRGIPAGTGIDPDSLRRVLDALVDADVPAGRHETRLPLLLESKEWRAATRDLLRQLRRCLHNTVSTWSSVMLLSRDLTDDIGRVSDLTEEMGRLGHALTVEGNPTALMRQWDAVLEEAEQLRQRFYATARSEQLEAPYPDEYQPTKSEREHESIA